MPHNEDVLRITTIDNTTVVTPEMLRRMDILASESLNGDNGGTWSPASPIVIGGDGVYLDNVGTLEGGVKTGSLAATGAIRLADAHWPSFTARTRRIVFSLNDGLFNNWENIYVSDGTDPTFQGINLDSSASLLCPLPGFRFLRGSKIKDVTLNWRTGIQPTSNPLSNLLPRFLLIAKLAAKDKGAIVTQINTWTPNTTYAAGDKVISGSLVQNTTLTRAFLMAGALGSPVSGASEPAGFATAAPGSFVTDNGSILWLCVSLNDVSPLNLGAAGNLYDFAATPAVAASATAYYNANQPKTTKIQNVNLFSSIVADAEYYLFIKDPSNTQNTFHSLVIDFDNFLDMRPGY